MHVVLVQAQPHVAPSMRRMAQALLRYLPVSCELRYVSETPPGALHYRLPGAALHAWYVLMYSRYLQRLASRHPPGDVIHLIDHSEAFLLPALRARLKVTYCHDLIPLVEEGVYSHLLSRWIGRWLYRNSVRDLVSADGVVACSHATAQDAKRLLGVKPERLRVVYPGVDSDFFVPLPEAIRRQRRDRFRLRSHEVAVLHVGSNAPYKNVPTILRALAHMRENGMALRWFKVGEPLSAPLQRLARRLGIDECVHYESDVDDERLRELYQISDVLLFPSLREGFGLPVLEALACGTPAVIADVPALNEWAGKVCPSAPPYDAPALCEKVRECIEESRSPAARHRLREFAVQYDWRRVASQIVEAYREWEQ